MTAFSRAGLFFLLIAALSTPEGAYSQARKRSSRGSRPVRPAQQKTHASSRQLGDEMQIADIKKRIQEQITAVEPDISNLREFMKRYPTTEDLSTLDPERERLRRSLDDAKNQLNELLDEFKALRKEFQYKRGVMIIAQFMTGDEPAKVDEDLKVVLALGDYPDQVKNVIQEATKTLNMDKVEYQKIVDHRKAIQRRRQLYIAGSLGSGALIAFVLFAVRAKRRRKARTLTGIPVAHPPAPAPGAPPARPITISTATPHPALIGTRTPMPDNAVPDMIAGNYKVSAEIEKGPLGAVYRAVDTSSGKTVLIKRIREELHRTEKDLERFLARSRFVAQMKHPNLAEVYSVFLEQDRIHLVIEDPGGSRLSKFLDSGSRISLGSAKRLLKQTCALLDFAHSKKIIHGDLMPSNIFLTQEGTAKIMDFGIGIEARKVAAKLNWAESIGSPAYMAPEQELGSVFPASDGYSLAVILYEMLTSRLPFEGPNFLAQKREMHFQPASRFAPDIPKGIDPIFSQALRPEPQMRFQTASAFFSAIDALPLPKAL